MTAAIAGAGAGLDARERNALVKLNGLSAGQALQVDWQRRLKWQGTTVQFKNEIIASLQAKQFIFCRRFIGRDIWLITDDGLRALGATPDAPGGLPVAAPTLPDHRPLARRFMANFRDLAREGSLDYRNIPSRFGDQLVAPKA